MIFKAPVCNPALAVAPQVNMLNKCDKQITLNLSNLCKSVADNGFSHRLTLISLILSTSYPSICPQLPVMMG